MSRMDNPSMQQSEGQTGALREKAEKAGKQAREMGEQLKGAAQEQYEQLRHSAQEYYEQGRQRAVEWEHEFEDYVRDQPIKSILIAAGVGMILGFLWRRS